jgi:hypothetical protein
VLRDRPFPCHVTQDTEQQTAQTKPFYLECSIYWQIQTSYGTIPNAMSSIFSIEE